MSANPPETEHPRSPAHLGGEALYDGPESTDAESSSLKVQLGEHLDASTRESLLTEDRARARRSGFQWRERLPMLAIAGGIAVLLIALTRRSMRD